MKAKFISTKGYCELSQLEVNKVRLFVIDQYEGEEMSPEDEFDVELYCYEASVKLITSQMESMSTELKHLDGSKYFAQGKVVLVDEEIFIDCGQIKLEIEKNETIKNYIDKFIQAEIQSIEAFEKYIPTELDLAIDAYTEKKFASSIKLLEPLAQNGNPEAQWYLACSHYHGRGTNKNLEQAANWFEESAINGYVKAQNYIGQLYWEGKGVKKSYAKAKMWYQAAIKNGSNRAIAGMGHLYLLGLGVKKNPGKAYTYFKESAAKHDSWGLATLGWFYESGNVVKQDFHKAAELYQKSVSMGNGQACHNLGLAYLYGRGVEQDKEKAKDLILRACKKEIEDAIWFMNNRSHLFDG